MTSDRYGSARWAETKVLKVEGVYTHEQMAGNQAEANQSNDYWDDSSPKASVESQGAIQSEQADYWAANNSATSENANEHENSLSKDASC